MFSNKNSELKNNAVSTVARKYQNLGISYHRLRLITFFSNIENNEDPELCGKP